MTINIYYIHFIIYPPNLRLFSLLLAFLFALVWLLYCWFEDKSLTESCSQFLIPIGAPRNLHTKYLCRKDILRTQAVLWYFYDTNKLFYYNYYNNNKYKNTRPKQDDAFMAKCWIRERVKLVIKWWFVYLVLRPTKVWFHQKW